MDHPAIDPDSHRQALHDLARLNRATGSAGLLWHELTAIRRAYEPARPLRILDLGCGGGDVTVALARRARRAGQALHIVGCDLSATALAVAGERARQAGVDIDWVRCDAGRPWRPRSFDVAVSTLLLHHLDERGTRQVLRSAAAAADHLRFIDLARVTRGWWLARAGTRLLSRSPVVRVDGPRSVEGAYTRAEIAARAQSVGLHTATVHPCWPARFVLRWNRGDESDAL